MRLSAGAAVAPQQTRYWLNALQEPSKSILGYAGGPSCTVCSCLTAGPVRENSHRDSLESLPPSPS